jgi:hypothetical protein
VRNKLIERPEIWGYCLLLEHNLAFTDCYRNTKEAGHQQLMPVILATQEAEIRRITVHSQAGQIVLKTLS